MLGSYAMIGMMLGALVAGTLGDLVGRRKVMIVSIAWFSIGMAVSAMTESVTAFGIWRFITGLGVGALAGTTGAMAAEFAPPGKKNLATAFCYAGIPLGSLLSALLAIFLLPIIGWRAVSLYGEFAPFGIKLPALATPETTTARRSTAGWRSAGLTSTCASPRWQPTSASTSTPIR